MYINIIELNTSGMVNFDIKPNLEGYTHDQIKKLNDISVKGTIIDNGLNYELKMNITGKIILKSSINSSDVSQKIDIQYDEFIENLVEDYKKNTNLLDISPIIWENILLEIPIRAFNEADAYSITSGDGWEIL